MERVTLDLSFPNFVTIGLIGALLYAIFVGGYSLAFSASAGSQPKTGA